MLLKLSLALFSVLLSLLVAGHHLETQVEPSGNGLPESLLEFNFKATVYDYDTGEPIKYASVVVRGSDGSEYFLSSDAKGSVQLLLGEIRPETKYSVDVSKNSFIGTGDSFSTIGILQSTTFAREYFIKRIELNKGYDLPLVLFESGMDTPISNRFINSFDSLDYWVGLMRRNPSFTVQVAAYCDINEEKSFPDGTLSSARAKNVVDILISKGIDPDRLEAKGVIGNQLIHQKDILNMPSEDQKNIAHQVNRRTELRITSYNPKFASSENMPDLPDQHQTNSFQQNIYVDFSKDFVNVESVYLVEINSENCESMASNSHGLTQLATARLTSQYNVLERQYLDMILDEQKLSMTGLVYEQEIVKAGCLHGAQGIIFCEEGCIDGQPTKHLKLVDCTSGHQQWSALGLNVGSNELIQRVLDELKKR